MDLELYLDVNIGADIVQNMSGRAMQLTIVSGVHTVLQPGPIEHFSK